MKEKRNQKDDRQWKADQPNKSAFYRSHPHLPPRSNCPLQFWFPDGVVCSCRCRFLAAHVRLQLRRVVGDNNGIHRTCAKSRVARHHTVHHSLRPILILNFIRRLLIGRRFMRPAGVRPASTGAFDVRPVIPSHRGRVQKRIERVLRQIAIGVVDRVALDQHATAFGIVANPADDAAPGDVLSS